MRRNIFKKSMALLLALVMLTSSALVNIPVYAGHRTVIEVPVDSHSMDEGLNEIQAILELGDPDGSRLFLKQSVFDVFWYKDWDWGDYVYYREGNMTVEEVYTELLSTEGLPAGTYELLVTDNTVEGLSTWDDIIVIVTLTVNPNNAPTPKEGSLSFEFEIDEDTSFTMNLLDVFEDPDGDDIEITSMNSDADMTSDETHLRFTPAENWNTDAPNSPITGSFTVTDDRGAFSKETLATFTLTVNPVNDPPVANDDEVTFTVGDTYEYDPVVGTGDTEDTDVDGPSIVITSVELRDPSLGTINFTDNTVTFTADLLFTSGTVLIDYTISDEFVDDPASDDGVITMVINDTEPVDNPVIARDDSETIDENDDLNIVETSIEVLTNDIYLDGFGSLVVDVADARLNAVADNTNEVIKVTPDSNLTGTFDISYTLFDDDGDHDSGTLVLTIGEDDNDMNLILDEFDAYEEGTTKFNVLDNDVISPDETVESIVILEEAEWGAVTVALDGTVTYVADGTYEGPTDDDLPDDTFMYQVTLVSGEIASVSVEVTLIPVDYIKLQDDRTRMDEDSSFTKIDVLDNDIIPEKILEFEENPSFAPLHGEIEFVKVFDGSTSNYDREASYINYKPDEGFVGEDSFGYKVKDADGTWDEAMVEVEVEAIERVDHVFEALMYMFPNLNQEGAVDVSTLVYPSHFDLATLEVTDVTFVDNNDSGNGAPDESGTLAKYTPSTMTSVDLTFTVEDTYGHVATGTIRVVVFSNTNTDYVIAHDLEPIRVNQYSDPEGIRLGVEYHTSDALDPDFKFEYPEFAPELYPQGFYEFNKFDPNGKYISVTKYFGEFGLKYGMENDGLDVYADVPPLREVSVNGKPLIDLDMQVDPTDIDYGFAPLPLVSLSISEEEQPYASFDILTRLYGYDFEDYYHGGLSPSDTMFDEMPIFYDDSSPANPGEVRVEFRLNGTDETTIHDISEFWTYVVVGNIDDNMDPEGSVMSGEDTDIDYTIYDIQFMMTDSEGFASEWTESWMLKVINEAPEIVDTMETPADWFKVIQAGDAVDFEKWFMIEDDEDYTYARAPYDFIDPDFDENMDQWLITILDYQTDALIWDSDESQPFDTEMEGTYKVYIEYTDLHGLTVEDYIELWIVPESYLDVDLLELELESNGYFPTFMGVFAEFWQPDDFMGMPSVEAGGDLILPPPPMDEHYNGDIIQYVIAMIDGNEVARAYVENNFRPSDISFMFEDYGELIQLTGNETVEITYHAVQEIFDDGVWFKVVSNLILDGDSIDPADLMDEDNYIRIIHVTDADYGDYFLSSDIGDMMQYGPMYPPWLSIFEGDQYPLLTKNKVVTIQVEEETDLGTVMVDEEVIESRIVTTIAEIFTPTQPDLALADMGTTSDGMEFRTFILLDIAETFEDDVFGISLEDNYMSDESVQISNMEIIQKLWKLDDAGSFKEVLNIGDVLDSFGLEDEIKSQFNEDPEYISVDMMPIASLTADKDGNLVFIVSVRVSVFDEFTDYYNAIVVADQDGMVLSTDVTATQQGYSLISDVAFDETMEHLYAIASHNPDTFTGNANAVSIEGLMGPQELIEFIMVEEEPEEEVEPEGILDDINIATYYSETVRLLDMDYHYTGITALNGELVLIKIGEEQDEYPSDMTESMMMYGIYTFAEFINLVEEDDLMELDLSETTSIMLPVPFTWGLGAAANYDREIDLVASPTNITAGATVNLIFTGQPEVVYGEGVWSHDGSGTLSAINIDAYGVETATYTSVAGTPGTSTVVTFTVDTNLGPVTATVIVSTPAPPAPSTPTRTTTNTPTIRVTLDTDAVTLDYGETADPDFTSYDFTETVTGTTNENVTWELSDDTFVTVDENGIVTAKGDVPTDTGDFTVTLTVRTVVGNATDTATILFEEQTPLGAIEFFDPYIAGYTDGSFRPTNYVTRAEVSSMFAKILKLNITTSSSQKFADVPDTHWAFGQVQAMYRSGMFSGYLDSEGTRYFDPEAPISRAEIAQVFTNYWKFLNISVNDDTVTSIPDVETNFWAAAAINRIFNTGIVNGFDDGTFRPNEATLREQIVSMINRLIDRPANEAEESKFTDILPTHNHFGDIEAASQTFLKPQSE